MKYAHLDGERLLGWYDTDVHKKIPSPCIAVSDEVWQQAINQNSNAYVDGSFVVKNFVDIVDQTNRRIIFLQSKLNETDYKVLPDYDKIDDSIIKQRQEWREEIRTLRKTLES